jgi:hypothetical protein
LIVLLKNTILLLPFSACVTNFSPAESYFWRCRRSLTSLFGSYSSTSLPSNYFSPYVTLNIFLLNVTLILNSYCIASPCFNFFFTVRHLQYYFFTRHCNITHYITSLYLKNVLLHVTEI